MRVGAVVLVAHRAQLRFLAACVRQLLPLVDCCVVVCDRTNPREESRHLVPLDERVIVESGEWAAEHEARNRGMDLLAQEKCDYVLVVDGDEIFLERDLRTLKNAAATSAPRALLTNFSTYWKTPDYLVVEPEPSVATVLVRGDVRFKCFRSVDDGEATFINAPALRGYRLSYVCDEEGARERLESFGQPVSASATWLDEVWRAWDRNRGIQNLHPTYPAAFERAVYAPDRDLYAVLATHGCVPNDLRSALARVQSVVSVVVGNEDRLVVRAPSVSGTRESDPRKRARIIGTHNRGGLSRDATVLRERLEKAGWDVEWVDPSRAPRERVPVQFFLENTVPALFERGERNIAIPNPEFWTGDAQAVDIWAKTAHAHEVFGTGLNARSRLIGWTSVDRFDARAPRERSFLHVCGQSNRKGTGALVRAWRPEWPTLTVVALPLPWWRGRPECAWIDGQYTANVRIITEHLSDDLLRELQNRSVFHIYPSLYEGFGHSIWEGLSCGAVVLVPDAPPFDTMPASLVRIRAGVSTQTENGLVADYCVGVQAITEAVEEVLRIPERDLPQRASEVREDWRDNFAGFADDFADAVRDLSVSYEGPSTAGWPSSGASPPAQQLVVCHSPFERCGIAEYGRKLDEELFHLFDHGWSPQPYTYRDGAAILAASKPGTVLLIHYEPSLMPRRFLDTLRDVRARGARVVACCHWFVPELLQQELGALVDYFVVHRDYGVRSERVVEIPLACPTYEPSDNREALRRKFGMSRGTTVLTTIGFLSKWKRIPEILDAILKNPVWLESTEFRLHLQTPMPFSGDNDGQAAAVESVLSKRGRGRVTFSMEFLPEQDLLDLAHASDLGFVFHGQNTKSSSAATKQFVSARSPLVTTASTHSADVREGVVRVPGLDIEPFVRAMFETASDSALLARLREGMGREYERLRMRKVAEQYSELFTRSLR